MFYFVIFLVFLVGFFIGLFFGLFFCIYYFEDKFFKELIGFEDRVDYTFEHYFGESLFSDLEKKNG